MNLIFISFLVHVHHGSRSIDKSVRLRKFFFAVVGLLPPRG